MVKLYGAGTLYHGPKSIESLKTITGKRAVIVTGHSSTRENGSLQRVCDMLQEKGWACDVFSGVEPDPSIDTVRKGAAFMQEKQPDWIIGLGGTSSIDAAKAMWVLYEHPELPFETMIKPFAIPALRNKARFVAIPTTSGTGTETTSLAVITDRVKGVKYPIASHELQPDLAIVDGDLCQSMPADVTANTGMDALTHCIEAYVSNVEDNYADAFAKGGIQLIFANLKNAVENPDNLAYRQNMHDASALAGYAFTNSWLGIVHSMAHQMGAIFGIPHGRANALALPNVMRYNAKATDRFEDLAKLLGLSSACEFIKAVENLKKDIHVPASIKEYGIAREDWMKEVHRMAENAHLDVCTSFNPRPATVEDLEKLYIALYEGESIDF